MCEQSDRLDKIEDAIELLAWMIESGEWQGALGKVCETLSIKPFNER
jgi:hypothetical protein